MSKKLDLTCNRPEKKSQLTKDNMLDFMLKSDDVTEADKKWFKKLMNDNKKNQKNNLTGEVTEVYDLSTIREAFAKKYFPHLSKAEKAAAKKKKNKETFEDKLNML